MIGKIFKAYDIRATYPDMVNEEAAWKVGYATGIFLKNENEGKSGSVLVSRDMRPHSPSLAKSLIEGLRAADVDVVDLGMCDTSFLYFAIPHLNAIGGIQTTASHNPINYNGFKISRKQAKPIGANSGLKDIQAIAESLEGTGKPAVGKLNELDLWDVYRKHIQKFFIPPTRKMKVYVDASNGMAGVLVPRTLEGMQNVEIVPLNFEIGQGFAHEPNPLVAENMIPTQQGVRKVQADIGACFDGDADRCMLTDEKGEIIGCDHLTAALVPHFVALNRIDPASVKPTTIVYDLRASKVVEETIRAVEAIPERSRVGHVFMKAALRECKGIFGGELSGHFYFRDNNFADSGAITLVTALSVLGQQDKPMSELIAPYRKYPQSGEMNFEVEDKQAILDVLPKQFGEGGKVDDLDGVTVDCFDSKGWWFNVRASNTEPLLRLNAEAQDPDALDGLMKKLKPLLGEPVQGH